MSPQLALLVYSLFIAWLFYLDVRTRPAVSKSLWIVILWAAIICTRPVSAWLAGGQAANETVDIAEGSPLDRNVFLLLLVAGIVVLKRRHTNWQLLFLKNRWLFLFYLFFALSAFWSDYPLVTFKRWVKEMGNVVMVLIILSERNPVVAVRTVFLRLACLFVPLSILLIKYYSDLGRGYDRWSGKAYYQGATMGKNMLGGALVVLALFLVWELLQLRDAKWKGLPKPQIITRIALLAMAVWLLSMADSATSIACVSVGSVAFIVLGLRFIRKRMRNVIGYGAAGVVGLLALSSIMDLGGGLLKLLGRDPTLTGRTEIWQAVLSEKSNPLLGSGFYSFWLGSRAERLSEKYSFHLGQAHNGYLETYLDGGLVGVSLLLAVLLAAGRAIKRCMLVDPAWGSVRLVFWLIVLVYNWTEASFCRLTVAWLVMLLVMVEYPVLTARGGLAAKAESACGAPQNQPTLVASFRRSTLSGRVSDSWFECPVKGCLFWTRLISTKSEL